MRLNLDLDEVMSQSMSELDEAELTEGDSMRLNLGDESR